MSPKPRFHWLAYYASPWEMKESFRKGTLDVARVLHQTRDSMAFADFAFALASIGYEYVGPILNVPVELYKGLVPDPEPVADLRPGDLLVQVLRPGVGEERTMRADGVKVGHVIPRSNLDLECAIRAALESHFLKYCSRDAVFLRTECRTDLGTLLSANAALNRYVRVHFRSKNSACYSQSWCNVQINRSDVPAFARRTAGYLAYIPDLSGPFTGVSVLLLWGQAGFETMFVAWAIRHRFVDILRQIKKHREQFHFVMAEWTVPKLHTRPTSLRAFEDGQAEEHLLFHAARAMDPLSSWDITAF